MLRVRIAAALTNLPVETIARAPGRGWRRIAPNFDDRRGQGGRVRRDRRWVGRTGVISVLTLVVVIAGGQRARAQAIEADKLGKSINAVFTQVADELAPCVVTVIVDVDARREPGVFGRSYGGLIRQGGSGVFMSADGYVLTNQHLVANATRITVELNDGRTLPATLIGADSAVDIAVLKVAAKGVHPAHFGIAARSKPGEFVVAIGAPFGLRQTVTIGAISALHRHGMQEGVSVEYVQTDAVINPGNSGGPLVNLQREVIGINTWTLRQSKRIGFAVPSELAREIAAQLIQTGRVSRSTIGIEVQALDAGIARYLKLDGTTGALITKVAPNSSAARAGLRPGDAVLAYAGVPTLEPAELLSRIASSKVGSVARLDVKRQGVALTLSVRLDAASQTLGGKPDKSASTHGAADPLLGMRIVALTPDSRHDLGIANDGAVALTEVVRSSIAEHAGLQRGDVILEADLKPVLKPRDVLDAVSDGRALLRVVTRRGEVGYVLVEMGDPE